MTNAERNMADERQNTNTPSRERQKIKQNMKPNAMFGRQMQ